MEDATNAVPLGALESRSMKGQIRTRARVRSLRISVHAGPSGFLRRVMR